MQTEKDYVILNIIASEVSYRVNQALADSFPEGSTKDAILANMAADDDRIPKWIKDFKITPNDLREVRGKYLGEMRRDANAEESAKKDKDEKDKKSHDPSKVDIIDSLLEGDCIFL